VEKEHAEYIEYFASDNGYVVFANNELRISKTLKLEGADFKSSATIDAGDDQRDISVHIQHKKSHSEDAIGSGVRIDVKELNVEGSVGSNVTIATIETPSRNSTNGGRLQRRVRPIKRLKSIMVTAAESGSM